jgi:hypothetical protein
MNNGIENSYSGTKINKKKANYKKLSVKKNLQIMNDPAFHLNRTLKAYINYKLNANASTEKIETLKNSVEITKTQNHNNSFNRAKTLSNIINKKKLFSKKKVNKLMSPSHYSKKKKLLKSNSSNKLNLSNYIYFYNKGSININNKINKNKIVKKNSNNSQKYIRYSGSTALSNNDTNQILDKNNSIFPYNNNNNIQILTNHSTLDINSLKTPVVGQTTSKKNKFSAQYFPQNVNDKNKLSNLTNIKNNKFKNYNLIKNRQNLIKNYPKNLIINDKLKNQSINSNIINKTDNNIKYLKINDIYKETNQNYHNINDNDSKYSYTLSNINNNGNTPKKMLNNNKININISNINNNDDNSNINSITNKIENEIKKECDNKYLKKIEMLENENKLLKGEINDSNNRLLMLENKINELLLGKNSIEKEECPQPTPYVKKYSLETIQNLNQSPLTINTNSEIDNKNALKEKNKQESIKINMNYSKLLHINTSKPNILIKERKNVDTPTKINVNKFSKNFGIKKKEKKKICKKINNQKYFENKKAQLNYFTEENKNYH